MFQIDENSYYTVIYFRFFSHHSWPPNRLRSGKKKTIAGVNVQQLSKWVSENVQEKSKIDKMETVLRRKLKGNSKESMREIRWGRRKWDPNNKYHDYGAKLLIVLIEKLGRLDFLSWKWEGLIPEEKKWWERMRQREKVREFVLEWFFFFFFFLILFLNHWIAYIPCVNHPI